MTTFLRLLADQDKARSLADACIALRSGRRHPRIFEVLPQAFRCLPSMAFAYWINDAMRDVFGILPSFEAESRFARQGLATADDFRFLRLTWELRAESSHFVGFAKGGTFSPFYADIYLWLNWQGDGGQIRNFVDLQTGKLQSRPQNTELFGRPGLTWPRRTKSHLSMRAMPKGCAFGDKGPAAFVAEDLDDELLCYLALSLSRAFHSLVEVQLAAADARPGGAAHSFEVGVIQKTPVPNLNAEQKTMLGALARRAWSLKRKLDTTEETSHAFILPAALRSRLGDYDTAAIEGELARIHAEIDEVSFDFYGFSDADRRAVAQPQATEADNYLKEEGEDDDETAGQLADAQAALLSWAIGVTFGRFDWRLAIGERTAPPEPAPFDSLPAKSPGMLPDGATPFHRYGGVLVDDPGNLHDLAHLVEEVLARVEASVSEDVRHWLQRDFFAFHLQRHSRSRRKAPIYWPLATASGSYTLWVYYPSLTSQTLYTAINDFVEPKLKDVGEQVASLRVRGSARTRAEEKQFEALQAFELELIELRDTLLKIAPAYRPYHDDGVQITAAPLWPLFRHKPWQKVLKETWAKLEKGDYDWAHLAMNYWPARVREKCRTDKSLAIAHGLEDLYQEPSGVAAKQRVRRQKGEADG